MRNRNSNWCSAMAIALVLVLAPITAKARLSEPPPPPQLVEPTQPEPSIEGPSPAQVKRERMRKSGIGLMASGGAVATAGFGVVLAFTILGDQQQGEPEPVITEIEKSDALARIGGVVLASGLAVVAVGGIVFARAKREATSSSQARVRVLPALGGVVLSGEF
jgi:hypothetical protein